MGELLAQESLPDPSDISRQQASPHGSLPKTHTILEKGMMEYRPFGADATGEKIRDVSGMTIRANIEYLEESISLKAGLAAGAQAVEDLCTRLNERIRDPAYHVTPALLKNMWHSYSYEF
ncbi:MAG: hypothetical protein KGJ14_08870, partial [Nitrospirota bacterium]|nr:hypothetical protein [Nitrospirota bacterium]